MKMNSGRALLIKPRDYRSYAVIPNLGLGYLAASLQEKGFGAEILDCNNGPFDLRQFEDNLRKRRFDIVGFQLFTSALTDAQRMIEAVKRILPDSVVVVGGPHPSGDPEHALRFLRGVDFAVVGEGEKAIVEIMSLTQENVREKEFFSKIDNLAFIDGNGKFVMNRKVILDNLDEIPMPAWDLIDPRKYATSPHGTFSRGTPIAPIVTSRGCPYPCAFCAVSASHGKKLRRRSSKNVLDEMDYLCREYGIEEFHIEDDNFTFDKAFVLEICEGMRKRGLDVWWACPNGIRLDTIDAEMLRAMEDSGCYSVALGIESGSDRVLQIMRKKLTVKEIENSINLIKQTTKIHLTGFFLLGFPGETVEDMQATIDFAKKIKIDKANFAIVMPFPGSQVHREWKNRIGDESVDWMKFLYYQIVPGVSGLEEKVLKRYLKRAMSSFYFRPKILLGALREIKTFHQLKILVKRMGNILFH